MNPLWASLSWLALAMIASAAGTWRLRRYAIARNVLDVPNERSSHSAPTPRGGGAAIVVVFLAATLLLWALGAQGTKSSLALLGAGGIAAIIGFLDDHGHIAARWRLLAHFAAAGWALTFLGGPPPVQLFHDARQLGPVGDVLAAVALVWLLNLYNFMDGIDGLAATEAITVCVGAIIVYACSPAVPHPWLAPAVLAAAVLGFLIWNFPPARIFMGDAGSGFLGIVLGVLALDSGRLTSTWMWSWVILLGVFVVDATVTLLVRLWRGQKVYQAHRSHAYQHAAQRLGAHRPVTLVAGAINLLWLLPWAVLVGTGRILPVVGVAIAYAPLVGMVLRYRAGRESAR